jgi:hypothetical protein
VIPLSQNQTDYTNQKIVIAEPTSYEECCETHKPNDNINSDHITGDSIAFKKMENFVLNLIWKLIIEPFLNNLKPKSSLKKLIKMTSMIVSGHSVDRSIAAL